MTPSREAEGARSALEYLGIRALAFCVRRLPGPLRHWRLELLSLRLSQRLRGRLGERVVRTRDGLSLLVDGESQVGRVLYATGRYEDDVAAILRAHLRPGDTFVDGGAHIGFFTILASRIVGPAGNVVAFEPSTTTRAALSKNLALNACSNVVARSEALGSTSGRAQLRKPAPGQSGQATLRSAAAADGVEDVVVLALDSLSDAIGKVHVVKLDLEGFELEALKGMRRTLETHHPAIVVEVTDEFLKASHAGSALALYRFLLDLGYTAHVIGDEGVVGVPSDQEWGRLPAQFNALFTASVTERSQGAAAAQSIEWHR